MKRSLIISLTVVSLAFLCFANLSYAALAGKITNAQGRVDVLKPGRNTAVPVKTGDIVDTGDIYRAKSDGRAEITFINGNILRIAPKSRAEIKEAMIEGDKSSHIIKLYRGRVQAISGEDFIKKAAAFAEGNKFEVHTPNAVAGIRGSNMITSYLRRITGTLFIGGKGYQYNPDDPLGTIVQIVAGNISFVTSATGSPTMPRKASESEIAIQVNAMAMLNAGIDGVAEIMGASFSGGSNAFRPEYVPSPPTPLPPPEPTQPTDVKYTGSLTNGMFYDDNFNGSGAITANMSGSMGNDSTSGTAGFTGTPTNPDGYQIWSGGFEGTSDNGGAYLGFAGGSWTSWSGNAIGLLVENGKAGFLTTSPSGTSDGESFTGTGDLVKRFIGATALTPGDGQTLLDALKDPDNVTNRTFNTTDNGPWSIGDAVFSASKRKADTTTINPELVEGKSIGVIREMLSGSSYNNPTHAVQSGVYGEKLSDSYYSIGAASLSDDAAHNKLTMNIENEYMTTRFLGAQRVYYEGTYNALNSLYRMVGIGTIEGAPLSFVSKVSQGRFQGLFGGTDSLWTEDPVLVTFMGKLGNSGGNVDIHAADNGWNGGHWTTLLPGGVQHVNQYQSYNYIADPNHPVTQGVASPVTGNYASHGNFTNLLEGTTTFFVDASNRPTGIEYTYNGGKVVASMQTLEWSGTNSKILSNTLSYITSGGGKVLLLQDAYPWGSTRNNTTLNNLGVDYDIKTASEFVSADLSAYSTIIIASDQPQSFYNTMAANIGKLEGFLASGLQNVGLSPIFSYDYDNNRYMTYDGGAYRGLIGSAKVGENATAQGTAIYIGPDGSGGYLFSYLGGAVYENADNMFRLNGIAGKQQVRTAAELGIAPENLYNSTSVGTMDGTGAYFEGFFTNWQQISGQEGTGYTMALKNLDTHAGEYWGIYGISLYGNYNNEAPTTPTWTGSFGGQGTFGEYYNNGAWVADSGYWLINVDDGEDTWTGDWHDGTISGSAQGRLITRKKIGTTSSLSMMGSYDQTTGTWEMVTTGTWESDPLGFWSSVETPFVYYDGETKTFVNDGGMSGVMGGPDGFWYTTSTMLGKYTAGSGNNQLHVWTAGINSYNWDNNTFTTMGMDGWGAHKGYAAGTRTDIYTSGKLFALYIAGQEAPYSAGILYDDGLTGIIYRDARMLEMAGGINKVEMDDAIGIAPVDLMDNIKTYTFVPNNNDVFTINDNQMGDEFGRPYQYLGEHITITGLQWGVWHATIGGKYAGLEISDDWYAFIEHIENQADIGDKFKFGQYIKGTRWCPDDNRIEGSTVGYGADLGTGSTWLTVGETMGTFNPETSTFQTVSIGIGINTDRYLVMAGTEDGRSTLIALNVPCVNVGSANLVQTYVNPYLSNVSMNNVKFFGTNGGEAPKIWATNSVTGNYAGNPLNQTVGLSGGGLNAQFTMTGWNAAQNKWVAGIEGAGSLSGAGPDAYNGAVQFKGVGAGSITASPTIPATGSFSGTAGGAARAGGGGI